MRSTTFIVILFLSPLWLNAQRQHSSEGTVHSLTPQLSIAKQNKPLDLDTEFSRWQKRLKGFDITGKPPEAFSMLKGLSPPEYWKLRENGPRIGDFIYGVVLQSTDEQSILMYPAIPYFLPNSEIDVALKKINRVLSGDTTTGEPCPVYTNNNLPYRFMMQELLASFDIPWEFRDSLLVYEDHVTKISGRKVREMFNADSVYVYDIPLQEPFKEDFTYCTGMIIAKSGRPTIIFKWYFTKDGKNREWEYIEQLKGTIRYGEERKPERENRRLQIEAADSVLSAAD